MSEELHKDYLDEIELPEVIKKEIEEVSREMKLKKEDVKKLEEEVKKLYLSCRFEPGEAVGIISAQSISEPATQMTMRTYHFAGSAGIKITYGLPRLIEIFDAKKQVETPSMTLFLKKEFNNMDVAKKVAESIVEQSIENLVKEISINLNENTIEIEPRDLRQISRIEKRIKENIKDVKVKIRKKSIIVEPKNKATFKDIQKLKIKLLQLHVDGIKDIKNAVVRREGDEWIITTIGSNLKEIFNIKEVDGSRSFTNDIYETAKILGIEAARNLIIEEALKTMQEQGLDVDVRHIMLVADIMTLTGELRPIGRYGVAGSKASILSRAAFEETIKHLVRASLKNETDEFLGIFENVMVGQVVPCGTGMFEVVAKFEEEASS
ncbi:MAG: DNA-directed RNA polymerase subunit A'' [Candidatus Aenigmatarchaeota archaeon]